MKDKMKSALYHLFVPMGRTDRRTFWITLAAFAVLLSVFKWGLFQHDTTGAFYFWGFLIWLTMLFCGVFAIYGKRLKDFGRSVFSIIGLITAILIVLIIIMLSFGGAEYFEAYSQYERKAEIDEAVAKAASVLQLDEYLDRLPKALSGGQRQRVAIGRSIVRDPKVYLFDEPLSNLDAALRVATRIEIARLKESMPNSTMIYVTHDQVEAMTLASRIVVLANQGIAQVGSPLELYETPQNEFVAQFIGSPAMNLLPGRITGTGQTTTVALESGGEATSTVSTPESAIGSAVNVGVRPEDFTPTAGPHIFSDQIDIVEALGEVTLLYFQSLGRDEQVVAKIPGIHSYARGEDVKLTALPEKVHLFQNGLTLRTP